jgi:hypothetical protein
MGIEYTTKVNGVRVANEDGLTDVVKEVDVTITGTDSGCEFALPVTIKLTAPEAAAFTPFADVTETQVVGWVEAQDECAADQGPHRPCAAADGREGRAGKQTAPVGTARAGGRPAR